MDGPVSVRVGRRVIDVCKLDWTALGADLLEVGAMRGRKGYFARRHAHEFRACWGRYELFRRRIVMERHGYGEGAYAYFADPLPDAVQALREGLYRHLAPLADEAMAASAGRCAIRRTMPTTGPSAMRRDRRGRRPCCCATGVSGGYNRLHRDLYGELAFPFQAVFLLSEAGSDYTGGEFLLVENRMRMQAMGEAVPLMLDLVVFPVRDRLWRANAAMSTPRCATASSRVRSGERFALGIIFHDAA